MQERELLLRISAQASASNSDPSNARSLEVINRVFGAVQVELKSLETFYRQHVATRIKSLEDAAAAIIQVFLCNCKST